METVGLFDAWELWFNGQSLSQGYQLWGVPMLWWSRIGKLLQFVGALTVVLDLVGPHALRRWGREMNRSPFRRLRDWSAEAAVMQALCAVVVIVAVRQIAPVYLQAEDWVDHLFYRVAASLGLPRIVEWAGLPDLVIEALVLGIVFSLNVLYEKRDTLSLPSWLKAALDVAAKYIIVVGYVVIAVMAIYYFAPFVVGFLLVVGAFRGLLYLLDRCVARPVAWLLDRESPGQPLRWGASVTVFLGFSLDLLAS